VGSSPTRQPPQPEATGADDEIAEAFGMRVTNWRQRECAGRNDRALPRVRPNLWYTSTVPEKDCFWDSYFQACWFW
jgi:hypothetical protein